MGEIQIFSFQNCEVRVIEGENGDPWFVAKDVAEILGYSETAKMLRRLDEDECKKIEPPEMGGTNFSSMAREITIINESGLYNAVLGSTKPEAKAFKKWVTSEVLPSIRKHGAYVTEPVLDNWLNDPDRMIEALNALKAERARVRELEDRQEVDRPKVIFAESVAVAKTSILVGEMAKLIKQATGYDIGQNRFFQYLRDHGYLHGSGSQKNMPTQRSIEAGWFEIKEGTRINSDGVSVITRTPKITGKGQIYFINLFKKMAA